MDVERQIITAACEINPDANRLDELRQLLRLDFNAERLINLALQNGVGGLLYRNLEKADSLEKLGSEHRQRLQSIYLISDLRGYFDIKLGSPPIIQLNVGFCTYQNERSLSCLFLEIDYLFFFL